MGQAVKYAALAAAILVIILIAASIVNSLYPTEIVTNLGNAITGFLNVAGSFLQNVRGALNYFFGSHLPLTISIAFWLVVPIARVGYKVAIMIIRFANQ